MPVALDLSGTWQALPVERFDGRYDGNWLPAPVPGHWQQVPDLERHAGKVVYRRSFPFTPEPGRRYFLRVSGAFYWSTAYLNGARLGSNEGYFFPADYEITSLLRPDNDLLIELDCPPETDKSFKRQLTGVFHHWDCLDPASNPGGLWLPVQILATGPARLTDPFFNLLHLAADHSLARVAGRVTIDTPAAASLDLRITLKPRTFEGETITLCSRVSKRAGVHEFQYRFDVPHPRLWWTWDHGRPDLYTLGVEVAEAGSAAPSDAWETPFGIRTVDLRGYTCRLNGRRVFLRGNNYPPGDARLAAVTADSARRDVRLAREGNLNFLRVHAHVDHPHFYDACDDTGILLWQDFPMQWYYRPEVEPQAARQVGKMILHLGNRPSIAAWCMHNEPLRLFDTHKRFGPVAIARALFTTFVWNRNRDRMDGRLARIARGLDPHRFTTRSSGERGWLRQPGDGHYYYGWYIGRMEDFHRLYRRRPDRLRFVTEFGAESLPNLESSARFMAPDLKSIDWKKLAAHHCYQPLFMRRYVNPKNFDHLADFITATQRYQSNLNHYYIDRLRALKWKPAGGVTPFLLLDPNPAISWSVIDYWRVPKSSYFEMQKAMRPFAAFVIPDRAHYRRGDIARLTVFATNDLPVECVGRVSLAVFSPVGERVLEETWDTRLAPDLPARALANPEVRLRFAGEYRLALSLQEAFGRVEREYIIKVD